MRKQLLFRPDRAIGFIHQDDLFVFHYSGRPKGSKAAAQLAVASVLV